MKKQPTNLIEYRESPPISNLSKDEYQNRLSALENQVEHLNRILEEIYSSRSWRLLAPLRWVKEQQFRIARLSRWFFSLIIHPRDAFSLLNSALNVWRRDGWQGVKSSLLLYSRYYFSAESGEKDARVNSLSFRDYLRSSGSSRLGLVGAPSIPEDYAPKVSVVVPNFNHSAYLDERLTSIYEQSYKNFEVILLDDGSTDDSLAILQKYAEKFPEKTRCYFNESNSGSPFSQWEKGILFAEGELVWIAESDDFCEKNFLEKLVPFFHDDSILLSYSHSVFIDGNGKKHPFAFENYVGQINPRRWTASYLETAHNEVNTALGLLNTIPNVSSVLFRKLDDHFPLFRDPDWKKMQVCGDWLFYLNVIRGGSIAYCHSTHNYYRIHQGSASKKTHSKDIYYQEHELVALAIARLYKISSDLLVKLQERLKGFYFKNVEDGSDEKFDILFNINKIIRNMRQRKPNVLIATYGLVFGGGEIFPIRLANALYKAGVAVIVFNGNYEPTQIGVRKMLSSQIAIITNNSALRVNEMLEQYGIEIIHTHHASMENFFAVTRNTDADGIKHIATMHGMYEMMDNFKHNTKAIQKSVDHWVYTAQKNIIPFKKNGLFTVEKFTEIENGLPSPQVRKVDLSPLGISDDSFTACLASRALPDKGWFEAIEATKTTREITKKDVHLLLIGEGPVYTALKDQPLPDFIHLLGYKADLDDYLVSVQLGLLPTYFKGESFPLLLIGFFMAEIPVIASDIGEISKMIRVDDHQMGGVLIGLHDDKVDAGDLAEAMIKMVTDQEFYNKCIAVARLLKTRFDIDNIAQQYLAVYQHAMERACITSVKK